MRIGSNIRLRSDGRFEARYEKDRTLDGKIAKKKPSAGGTVKTAACEADESADFRRGGQGQVVKELAQDVGVFKRIAFLDDDAHNPYAMDTCDNCSKYVDEYPIAIPSVGNNALRQKWIEMLVRCGFILPTLVHSTATVSPSADIGYGTMIEAKVTISTNAKIGMGYIISSGAIIERDVRIYDWMHIECGTTVRK